MQQLCVGKLYNCGDGEDNDGDGAIDLGPQCVPACGPVTPNGCDCFGCCHVQTGDGTIDIYLGSGPDCRLDNLAGCSPCTFHEACDNPCEPEKCELCFGQKHRSICRRAATRRAARGPSRARSTTRGCRRAARDGTASPAAAQTCRRDARPRRARRSPQPCTSERRPATMRTPAAPSHGPETMSLDRCTRALGRSPPRVGTAFFPLRLHFEFSTLQYGDRSPSQRRGASVLPLAYFICKIIDVDRTRGPPRVRGGAS